MPNRQLNWLTAENAVNKFVCNVQEEVTAEVNMLLSLKKQYKDLTGEDFVPAQQPKKPDTAGKSKQTETGKKAEPKKKQDQEKNAEKHDGRTKSEKERQNEKGMTSKTDASKQSAVQESHTGSDSSGAREVKKVTR